MKKLYFISALLFSTVCTAQELGYYKPYGSLNNDPASIVAATVLLLAVQDMAPKHTPTTESTGAIYTQKLIHNDDCDCFKIESVKVQ